MIGVGRGRVLLVKQRSVCVFLSVGLACVLDSVIYNVYNNILIYNNILNPYYSKGPSY